jgi:hypothetical protein
MEGDIRIINHLSKIPAVRADIKLGISHNLFLRYVLAVFVFLYGLILPEEKDLFRDFLTKQKSAAHRPPNIISISYPYTFCLSAFYPRIGADSYGISHLEKTGFRLYYEVTKKE